MIGISGLSLVFHRRTALIVGLICLWLSTAGALHHDDLFGIMVPPASVHHSHRIGVVGAIVDPGPCVACEWQQTVGSSQTAHVSIVTVPISEPLARIDRLTGPTFIRHFDYASLRAPPVALS